MPSSQEDRTGTPASSTALSTDSSGGTVSVIPDARSSTSMGCSAAAPSAGPALAAAANRSTFRDPDGQVAQYASTASMSGAGPQQYTRADGSGSPRKAGEVEQPVLVLRAYGHTLAVARQFGQEGHGTVGPAAVEQGPLGARGLRLGDHREQGGDADASADEQVPGRRPQREVVARAAHPEFVALLDVVVDPLRAAASVGLAQHGDAPAGGVPRRVDRAAQ